MKSDTGRTDISTIFYLAKNQGVTLPHTDNVQHTTIAASSQKSQSDKNVPLSLSEEDRRLPLFDENIYNDLPIILERATGTMNIRQEKDLVLIGSIATISSILLPLG